MNKIQQQVKEFQVKFGLPVRSTPTVPPKDERILRARLIVEEVLEFVEASGLRLLFDGGRKFSIEEAPGAKPNIVGVADAIGDINYVVAGGALVWGLDAEEIGNEVHRSNMSKTWPGGVVKKDSFGKVIKPPTYSKPDFSYLGEMADAD